MRTGLRLPARVTLPRAPLIAGWHLRQALGVSKAVLHLWRKHHGFAPFHRDGRNYFTDTDAVQRWLEARGVQVSRL